MFDQVVREGPVLPRSAASWMYEAIWFDVVCPDQVSKFLSLINPAIENVFWQFAALNVLPHSGLYMIFHSIQW